MTKLPDRLDTKLIEKKWQKYWQDEKIFAWKNDLPKDQTFVIDTPPPTVSGLLHMGHVFSYTQADFVARFQRMIGKDVFYPMGFDDNGLPTERLVEKIIGKKAGVYEHENGHGSFVNKCREVVDEAEKEFEALFNSIALSVDWEQKYQTISPESQKISQASFVDLFNKGLVEKKFEPVFWDISDRTALAQADLVDKEVEGTMNYILFGVEGSEEKIEIMTTRPELLPACVAVMVHPEDSRYKHLQGKFAVTPLFGVRVKIIADDLVQLDKGTGAVMCCTFGDETDIKWWKKYDLELRVIIGKDGRFDWKSITKIGCDNAQNNSQLMAPNFIEKAKILFDDKGNGKTLKEGKEIIIEALKNTPSNHPPLEGGSMSVSESGRGQDTLKAKRFYSQETLENAQNLRDNQTNAEGLLWHYLQNKQLDGYKFRRQQPIENYIVDFVCFEKKLVIELDGGQHNEKDAVEYDKKRTEFLESAGFKVLRFWNNDVFKNISGVLEDIYLNLNSSDPSPNAERSTLPQGEGERSSLLLKQEKITRAVKCAERSGVPIEILVVPQWFIKILDKKEELKKKAQECNWFPQYMLVRIEQWIDGLSWDWCISRQRFFGVNFPVWYSKRVGEEGKILVADVSQLPCDPNVDLPLGYSRDEVTAETDIMDTWATSSISPQLSSKGISNDISFDRARHNKLFPADLRPQAHEIIRTWAFYTIVKAYLHSLPKPTPHPNPLPQEEREEPSIPWKNLMISGWCLAADKTKMSKSKGNVVTPVALIEEKGSDIVRYWASTSHLGADTAYSEEVFKIGQKLVTKLFNAAKFASMNFETLSDVALRQAQGDIKQLSGNSSNVMLSLSKHDITEVSDLWILSKLYLTVKRATESFAQFEYARAREAIEEFFWKDFCDNYLEICKVRSYGLAAEKLAGVELSELQKQEIIAKQQSAILTLRICLNTILKLFAPFIPHICEEIYATIFAEEFAQNKSINSRGNWPKLENYLFEQKSYNIGEAALAVLFEVRKFKSEKNISMKTIVKKIKVNSEIDLTRIGEDLKNVCNAEEIELVKEGEFVEIIS